MLNVRVCLNTGIYRLAVYDLDSNQVVLGVQSLRRLENLPICDLSFYS